MELMDSSVNGKDMYEEYMCIAQKNETATMFFLKHL